MNMENDLQKLALKMFRQNTFAPLMIMIRLMQRCNARCQMCDFWKTKDSGFSLEKMNEMITDANKLGAKELRLTGGDPLLYKHFFEVLDSARQKKIRTSFITNGLMLTDSVTDQILKANPHHIHVSIDSATPAFHDWERGVSLWQNAVTGLKLLFQKRSSKRKPKLVVNFVVSNKNYSQLPRLVELGGGEWFDEINLIPIRLKKDWFLSTEQIKDYNNRVVPLLMDALKAKSVSLRSENPFIFGTTPNELLQSTKSKYTQTLYSRIGCLVSKYTLFVNEDGQVYPCSNTPYQKEPFGLGNVFDQPLTAIWHSKKYFQGASNASNPKLCSACDPINCTLNLKSNLQKSPLQVADPAKS